MTTQQPNGPAHTAPAAPLPRIGWPEANAVRLARGHLSAPAAGRDAAPLAAALLGAHAQVMSAAELSLALRGAPGMTRTDVREALWTEHSLVKTYGPRGTVHLLPTTELPLWTGALSAVPRPAGMPDKARDGSPLLTPDQLDAVVAALGAVLADAELTVDEVTEAVAGHAGAWAADPVMEAFQDGWPRWRAATAHAAHAGVLCFGHPRGRRVTYTNPHRWLPGFTPLAPDVAAPALVRRYLYAYGPAAPAHFAKWAGTPAGWASGLFDALAARGEIERVLMAGHEVWRLAADGGAGHEAWRLAADSGDGHPDAVPEPPAVRLLPYFDAFAVASHPRDLLFPGAARERALARGQAGNFPVLLLDGIVGGVWHQRRSGRRLHLTVEPLSPLTRARHAALEQEAERVAYAQEARLELNVGQISVGAHA